MNSIAQRWRFFRAGGFDQVRIDSAAELLAIGELDQKLWVALSCPVKGIEFDARTLAFVDADGDGHVRAPELIAAVGWAGARLKDPEVLAQKLPGVPLAAIRDDDAEGARIAAAARALLAGLGKTDGFVGVDEASAAEAHFAEQALAAWQAAGSAALPLGDATAAAQAAVDAVAAKIEDYFVRCRLAAFDERAGSALNAADETIRALAAATLSADADAIAELPLARIAAHAPLPLTVGINPAWADRLAALRAAAVTPLLGERTALTEADWQELKARLAPYAAWLAAKPDAAAIVSGDANGVGALEKLARYVRDLMALANNFVAFRDFYTRQGKATFQVGTLYLDGRSAELCVAVNDAGKHAALASLSRICLVYCDCVRGAEKMSIAAAFTAGDADQLMAGRNGVFYDRQGRDWDAAITKIVDHPISLRQAFWSPYKRLARLVAEQIQKVAASKAREAEERLAIAAVEASKKVGAPAAAKSAPPPFDVGKFAGIFAAIGLAVGAVGTALASVLTGLLALKWWQLPFALAGLLLVVSGPAVVLAWFKLRSRNLGPILDANGWAINARARINIPFGTSLTQLAQLPANAERALADPYAEKRPPWKLYLGLFAFVVFAAFVLLVRSMAQ
ncbi:MAG: hypothetical protein HZC24_03405 [Rhodocyclales bacterium]|nr:hypothetical protein [Rhodocyclales bacterium]